MPWSPEEKVRRIQRRNETMAKKLAAGHVYKTGVGVPKVIKAEVEQATGVPLHAIPDRPKRKWKNKKSKGPNKAREPASSALRVVLANGASMTIDEARETFLELRKLFK